MQEMFDQLKASRKDEYGLAFAIDMLLENKQEMLEKEKEVMCGIYDDAIAEFDPTYIGREKYGEQYYNETFNTNER